MGVRQQALLDEQAVATRKALRANTFDVEAEKEAMRFGVKSGEPPRGNSAGDGSALPTDRSWFGITLASCERGGIRQSPEGIYIYGDEGRRELPVERGRSTGNAELRELYDALVSNKPIVHDGPWGMATLEVFLAIMRSGRERREVTLTQQCPARD